MTSCVQVGLAVVLVLDFAGAGTASTVDAKRMAPESRE